MKNKTVKRVNVEEFSRYSTGAWSYTLLPAEQAEYIRVSHEPVKYTRELRNNLNIDLDKTGHIVGIEILGKKSSYQIKAPRRRTK